MPGPELANEITRGLASVSEGAGQANGEILATRRGIRMRSMRRRRWGRMSRWRSWRGIKRRVGG